MEGRAWGGGSNLRSTLMRRDRIKRENRSNGGQDRMEGNIISSYTTLLLWKSFAKLHRYGLY